MSAKPIELRRSARKAVLGEGFDELLLRYRDFVSSHAHGSDCLD
jgi:hypothetical protein